MMKKETVPCIVLRSKKIERYPKATPWFATTCVLEIVLIQRDAFMKPSERFCFTRPLRPSVTYQLPRCILAHFLHRERTLKKTNILFNQITYYGTPETYEWPFYILSYDQKNWLFERMLQYENG